MKDYFKRANLSQETKVSVVAGNAMPPEKLVKKMNSSLVSIFVTSTFGDGGFPDQLEKFWKHLNTCKEGTFESMRYSVFGLGSSMYASFEEELFNRASKQLDRKIEELGGERIAPLGLGDEMDPRHYRYGFEKWMEALFPTLVDEIKRVDEWMEKSNEEERRQPTKAAIPMQRKPMVPLDEPPNTSRDEPTKRVDEPTKASRNDDSVRRDFLFL